MSIKKVWTITSERVEQKLETHSLEIADAVSRQCNLTLGLPYYQALHKIGSHRPDSQWGTIMGCLAIKHGPAWYGWLANFPVKSVLSVFLFYQNALGNLEQNKAAVIGAAQLQINLYTQYK
jgi:hypothetical protein